MASGDLYCVGVVALMGVGCGLIVETGVPVELSERLVECGLGGVACGVGGV